MAPQYVKPYVKANTNDLRDAEAIAEVVSSIARAYPRTRIAQYTTAWDAV